MKRSLINSTAKYSSLLAETASGRSLSFRYSIAHSSLVILFLLFYNLPLSAQDSIQDTGAFREVLKKRSEKIVGSLHIKNPDKSEKVVSILADQYFRLNQVHDAAKSRTAGLKKQHYSKTELASLINKEEENKHISLDRLHREFLSQLGRELSPKQVDGVKNGMTYNVMNVTYGAYLDMIPELKKKEKKQIYNWLKEAREKAMDEGSSDDKHKVFGKYKGRINNYLASNGYDLKAEEKKWQERIRNKKNSD